MFVKDSESAPPVALFVDRVRSMLSLEDYLFPYVWAQRQFRDDNYQMGSAALLEDMFFDTFGDYLQRHDPKSVLERRTGKEPWDYKFRGEGFSHKEALSPGFTAVWQAGDGPGNRTPRYPTWDFQHSVVFSYSAPAVRMAVTGPLTLDGIRTAELKMEAVTLSHGSLEMPRLAEAPVIVGTIHNGLLKVERLIPRRQWAELSVHEVRALVRPERLAEVGLWLLRIPVAARRSGLGTQELEGPLYFGVEPVGPLPGIYVFERDTLKHVPLESNNKAHYAGGRTVTLLMSLALQRGWFVPLPMWPAAFAVVTPPNLYQVQKERFDELFRARRRP